MKVKLNSTKKTKANQDNQAPRTSKIIRSEDVIEELLENRNNPRYDQSRRHH